MSHLHFFQNVPSKHHKKIYLLVYTFFFYKVPWTLHQMFFPHLSWGATILLFLDLWMNHAGQHLQNNKSRVLWKAYHIIVNSHHPHWCQTFRGNFKLPPADSQQRQENSCNYCLQDRKESEWHLGVTSTQLLCLKAHYRWVCINTSMWQGWF